MLFWKRKKPYDSNEQLLEEIKRILFPEVELVRHPDPDGGETVYQIERSIDYNLDNVYQDITDGICGRDTQRTLNKMVERLFKVRDLLDVKTVIHSEASRIVIDCDDKESEEIIAADENSA